MAEIPHVRFISDEDLEYLVKVGQPRAIAYERRMYLFAVDQVGKPSFGPTPWETIVAIRRITHDRLVRELEELETEYRRREIMATCEAVG